MTPLEAVPCSDADLRAAIDLMVEEGQGVWAVRIFDCEKLLDLGPDIFGDTVAPENQRAAQLMKAMASAVAAASSEKSRQCFCCDETFYWPHGMPAAILTLQADNPVATVSLMQGLCADCFRPDADTAMTQQILRSIEQYTNVTARALGRPHAAGHA